MRAAQGPLQTKALQTMREVLGEDFRTLEVSRYELSEDFGDDHCVIRCGVVENPGARAFDVEGKGVGMLDAFFTALRARYQGEFPSLESIRFSSFTVRGIAGDSDALHSTDAQAEATVGVTNSSKTEFEFSAVSPSVSHSSLEAMLEAVEYFLNSEQAYVRIYKARQHHKTTGRPEMVARYTELLTEMVRNTSYSSALERLESQE